MSEWYEKGYPGGPMVKVKGFPRGLYFPGAPGGDPSAAGPDIEAVKRCVSRAGRWPWQAFSQEFTREFATGKDGGNVADSGLAGVQRQGGLQGSGQLGEASFNLLRSIRIPEGLPNAGQPAMDAKSVDLFNAAYDKYKTKPPPANTSSTSARDKALSHLSGRVGFTEDPPNSNFDNRSNGIKVAQRDTAGGATYLDRQPWCGCWCHYALRAAGVEKLGSWMASVASIEQYAKQKTMCFTGWTGDRSKVKKGDLVVIGGPGVHVETVRGFDGSNTLTYGGNTSPGTSGSQSNGGGAFARTRTPGEVYGYALVRYPGE